MPSSIAQTLPPIIMPTCETHAAAARISAAMLDRYWPDHSQLYVLHADRSLSWLAAISGFVRQFQEETFILMLDDYALCRRPLRRQICAASRLMSADQSIGIVALGWWAGTRGATRGGFVELRPAPILLQAAIWRRDCFLALADAVDPRCSAWAFESRATQALKGTSWRVWASDRGELLSYRNLMHRGSWAEQHFDWLRSYGFLPSRGPGDWLAKLARAIGAAWLARQWTRVTGRPCGCGDRQAKLNRWWPFRRAR